MKRTHLSKDKILALTKLKAFAADKFSVTKIIIYAFDLAENIVGKGENSGHQAVKVHLNIL